MSDKQMELPEKWITVVKQNTQNGFEITKRVLPNGHTQLISKKVPPKPKKG